MATKTKKARRKITKVQCQVCKDTFKSNECSLARNGKLACRECWHDLEAPRLHKPNGDDKKWYVLQVEPGRESSIRQEISRQSKIHGFAHLVGRIFAPAGLKDVVQTAEYQVLDKGTGYATAQEARKAGDRALREFFDPDTIEHEWANDPNSNVPGYKVSVFPDKAMTKGKQSNTWGWQMKKVLETRKDITVRTLKYPGYLICNFKYDKQIDACLTKLKYRGCWGLLLRPVVLGHKVQVTKGRTYYNWKVRAPESDEIVAKGRELNKALAYEKAKDAKAQLEEFHPSELDSAESAELLIAQKAVNQICQDPTEKNRKILNYRQGDTVKVMGGAFKGLTGEVTVLDKSDPTEPKVKVRVKILGCPMEVEVLYHEVSK